MKKKNLGLFLSIAIVFLSACVCVAVSAVDTKPISNTAQSPQTALSNHDPMNDAFEWRRHMMRRMFDDMFGAWDAADAGSLSSYSNWGGPLMNIHQTDYAIVITCDVPGMEKKDISIEVRDRVLTVSGERKTQTEQKNEDTKYYMRELSYGKFSRSVVLPDNTDPEAISADYKDGVLTLTVPRTQEKKNTVKIDVK